MFSKDSLRWKVSDLWELGVCATSIVYYVLRE